jgi:phage baseplate assembly protein W
VYKDIPIFPSVEFAKDIDAVKGSIDMCLLFSTEERLFHPTFGCELEPLLFELMTDDTARAILFELIR